MKKETRGRKTKVIEQAGHIARLRYEKHQLEQLLAKRTLTVIFMLGMTLVSYILVVITLWITLKK